MKFTRCTAVLLLTLLPGVRAVAEPTVVVVTIREEISRNTTFLIRRGLREVADKNASALILELDTNGGRLDATEDILALLQHSPVKTYAFVNTKAYSAGAIIASGTDSIYMTPGSVIGAATPVLPGLADVAAAEREKMNSATRALVRATAQHKRHNPDVFEAMVDKDLGLVVAGKTVCAKGKLLTLTADEAGKTYGKPPIPLLSAGTVATMTELLAATGLKGATVVPVTPYGFELLARWITAIGPLLIIIGMVGIFIEMKTPGVMLPGLMAATAFGLYFLGYFGAGLAGWEELALFVVGLMLLAAEIFLVPGSLVLGVSGVIAIVAGLLMAMVERWPGATWPTWEQLEPGIITLGLSLGGAVAVCALLLRWLPETTLFRKFELGATLDSKAGYTSSRDAAGALLGAEGVAETLLRPAGKGKFGEQLVDVVTEGDFILKGDRIRIVAVEGSRVVVTKWT